MTEVLIAGSIAAMLATVMFSVLGQFSTLAEDTYAERQLNRQLQRATGLMRKDISRAQRILTADTNLILIAADGDTIAYSPVGAKLDSLLRHMSGELPALVATDLDTFWTALHSIEIPRAYEKMVPDTTVVTAQKCEESDMDALAASGSCAGWDQIWYRVKEGNWAAEQFWGTPDLENFTTASILVAKSGPPVDVDLLLEVYLGNGPGGYPGTLLANGRILKADITNAWTWLTTTLTTVVAQPVVAGETFWLVARPDGIGKKTYAGHVQVGTLTGCSFAPPSNDMCSRESSDSGSSWNAPNSYEELLMHVKGTKIGTRPIMVIEELPDTLGVSYELVLNNGETSTRSEGFIAVYNR